MLLAVVPACALLWLLKGPLIETLFGASYGDAILVLLADSHRPFPHSPSTSSPDTSSGPPER